MEGRGSDTKGVFGQTASAAGFILARETGAQSRNLMRHSARNCVGKLEVKRRQELAARKMQSTPARGKFFLDNPLS
jgi:hypothetical protein